MSEKPTLFDLKEKAKWSYEMTEKKAAINELSTYGHDAIPQLEEILNVTANEDIKVACIEAIKAIQGSNTRDDNPYNTSKIGTTSALGVKDPKNQKKEEEVRDVVTELRLADLPP